jgi:hypothetical protein
VYQGIRAKSKYQNAQRASLPDGATYWDWGENMPIYLNHRSSVVVHLFDVLYENVAKPIALQYGEAVRVRYPVECFLEIQ